MSRDQSPSADLGRRWGWALLTLMIAVVSAAHVRWLQRDDTVFPIGDSYAFLTQLLQFLDRFAAEGFVDFWRSIGQLSHGGRPPLYQIFTIPNILLFGKSEDSATSVNVVFTAILMISAYHGAALIKGRKAGLLAALLVAAYPPIIQLTRMYLPHSAVPACSALSLWMLLWLLESRSVAAALSFGASLAVGVLMHPSFIFFWTAPAIGFGIYVLLFQTEPRAPLSLRSFPRWLLQKLRAPLWLRGLLPGALMVIAAGLGWYLIHGSGLLATHQQMVDEDLDEFRGYETLALDFPEVEPSALWFAATAPPVMSNVLAALVFGGLIYCVVRPKTAVTVPALCLLTAVPFYMVLFPVLDWFHFAPALPFAAVLTATWILRLRHEAVRRFLSASGALAAGLCFVITTWGDQSWTRSVAWVLGAPLDAPACQRARPVALCPRTARPAESLGRPGGLLDSSTPSKILKLVLEAPRCRAPAVCNVMLIRDSGGLICSHLRLWLAREWPRERLAIHDDGSHRWGNVYPLHHLLNADFLIYSDLEVREPYQRASLALLASPPRSFAEAHRIVASFELVGGYTLRVLERVRPLTTEEVEETVAALGLEEKYNPLQYLMLASQQAEEGQFARALSTCDEGLAKIPESRRAPRAALETTKRQVLAKTGRFYSQRSQFDQAIAMYEEWAQMDPESDAARLHLAQAYRAVGDIERAIAELRRAIALAPDETLPHKVLANIYSSRGDHTAALEHYRRALAIDAADVDALTGLASVYRKIGSYDKAIAELERALGADPESPRAHRMSAAVYQARSQFEADIYSSRDDHEKAVEHYRRALAVNAADVDALTGLASVYREIGNYDKAIAELERALEVDPESSRAHRLLAAVHKARNQFEAAAAHQRRAVDLDPGDLNSRIGLAMTYRQMQKLGDAISQLEHAVALAPDQPRARWLLAETLSWSGDENRARDVYREILRRQPDAELPDRARALLERK